MITSLGFLLLAGVFMLAGQAGLRRARWPQRAPRLAIAVWQALSGAVVLSLLLACVSLAVPGMSAAGTLGEAVRACFAELAHQYSTPVGATVSTLSIGIFLLLSTRVTAALWRHHHSATRSRRDHLDSLALIAEQADDGVLVVDHDSAAVYCVADARRRGGSGAVVVTRGAHEILSDRQLRLVLRHERAHLRSRHDRLVHRSRALADALSWLSFFRTAHHQITSLVEMHADDAVPPRQRPELAVALYRLAVGEPITPPVGTLAAAGESVILRAHRLVLPHAPLRRVSAGLVVATIIGIAAAPAALALFPMGSELSHDLCVQLDLDLSRITTAL